MVDILDGKIIKLLNQNANHTSEEIANLDGEVEVDETYIGGKKHGKRGRGAEGTTRAHAGDPTPPCALICLEGILTYF